MANPHRLISLVTYHSTLKIICVHLFSENDLDSILGGAGYSTPQTSGIPVLSGGTSQPIWGSGLRRFLEEATRDVLRRPIVWGKAVEALAPTTQPK